VSEGGAGGALRGTRRRHRNLNSGSVQPFISPHLPLAQVRLARDWSYSMQFPGACYFRLTSHDGLERLVASGLVHTHLDNGCRPWE
jgi:hypothetical protein